MTLWWTKVDGYKYLSLWQWQSLKRIWTAPQQGLMLCFRRTNLNMSIPQMWSTSKLKATSKSAAVTLTSSLEIWHWFEVACKDLAGLKDYIKRDSLTGIVISTSFSPGSVSFVPSWLSRSQVYQGQKCILSSARCLQLCKPAGKRQVHELFPLSHTFI